MKIIYPSLFCKALILTLTPVIMLQSCTSNKKIYSSNCNDDIPFKRISFTRLIDSIDKYDQQYVEITGTYRESKEQSALYNDSLFVDHSNSHALWINFSQDCPLYLSGTHTGLFEYADGGFTRIKDKQITIRGKIDVMHKGHLGSYRGSIDRVSFIKL